MVRVDACIQTEMCIQEIGEKTYAVAMASTNFQMAKFMMANGRMMKCAEMEIY
jgi:hypothetical protein